MKVVLTIAGSDSSGGAGIQADLKTFEAFGVFGTSALTVLTAQNTTGVTQIVPMTPDFVKEQIEMVFKDFDVEAIKIGMLLNAEIIHTIGEIIKALHIPIVLDPVAVSKAGSPLLEEKAVEALKTLFGHATVITPNFYEAKLFFGYAHDNPDVMFDRLEETAPVLIKNNIRVRDGVEQVIDMLYAHKEMTEFPSEVVDSTNLHGTGCSFSSAIAANLALGHSLEEAIRISKRFIVEALLSAPRIGHGPGPVNHKQGGQNVILT